MTAQNTRIEKFSIGEPVSPGDLTDMEWVDFEQSFDRIKNLFFLAFFTGGEIDIVALCTMTEDGDIFALCELSGEGKPLVPEWRLVSEPDKVLVPKEAAGWCFDMALAPRNARILVLSDPVGEVYAAHWAQHPVTGDEAWLISESSDGSQHLCKAKAWASIPAMPESSNG